jgi:hypothetical protein
LSWPSSSPGARLRIPCRNPSKPTRPELSTAHDRSACGKVSGTNGTPGAGSRTAYVPCSAARGQAALRLWYVQHAGGWCACAATCQHTARELECSLRRYVALAPLLGGERDDAVEVAHRRRVRRRSVELVPRRSPHAPCSWAKSLSGKPRGEIKQQRRIKQRAARRPSRNTEILSYPNMKSSLCRLSKRNRGVP